MTPRSSAPPRRSACIATAMSPRTICFASSGASAPSSAPVPQGAPNMTKCAKPLRHLV